MEGLWFLTKLGRVFVYFFFNFYLCACLCVCMCMHTYVQLPAEARNGAGVTGGCELSDMGTLLRSSGRTAGTFNCGAISPDPVMYF